MKKIPLMLIAFFILPAALSALDFSLLVDQNLGVSGGADSGAEGTAVDYQAGITPRLSGLLGSSGEFTVSAGVTAVTEGDFNLIPELLRTEVSLRLGGAKITAGRMQYTAPFAGIADGLYDGFQFGYDTALGTFSAGAWYTGLLYKKKANITMTEKDNQSFSTVLDYDDFAGTYFASRRAVASLGWEHPAIAELVRAKFAVIAQFDLNDKTEYLNSQYITIKAGVPVKQFMFEAGGVMELAETGAGSGFNVGLAGELGVFWTLHTAFASRLSLTGYFSSADSGDSLAAFTPISAKTYGAVLEAGPSGISALSLDYTARLHKTFSAGISSMYFIRSDFVTYTGYPLDGEAKDKYLLGNEFFARLIWSPVSDIQINLGAGVFVPAMGNAAKDKDPLWRIKLAAVISL